MCSCDFRLLHNTTISLKLCTICLLFLVVTSRSHLSVGVEVLHLCSGPVVVAVVQLVEYRTRNQEVAGSTHTRSTASNLEQVANLLLRPTQLPTLSGTGNE